MLALYIVLCGLVAAIDAATITSVPAGESGIPVNVTSSNLQVAFKVCEGDAMASVIAPTGAIVVTLSREEVFEADYLQVRSGTFQTDFDTCGLERNICTDDHKCVWCECYGQYNYDE